MVYRIGNMETEKRRPRTPPSCPLLPSYHTVGFAAGLLDLSHTE